MVRLRRAAAFIMAFGLGIILGLRYSDWPGMVGVGWAVVFLGCGLVLWDMARSAADARE